MLSNMKLLITAGPTREHLDPVRFLSNRSSGRMGFAVAQAAVERGHTVTLVAGPVALPTPEHVFRVDVVSALDMLAAVRRLLPYQHALVMCAAVADWRPKTQSGVKLKKTEMPPVIELEPNPDILKTLHPFKENRSFVGFAAERPHRRQRRDAAWRRFRDGDEHRDARRAGCAAPAASADEQARRRRPHPRLGRGESREPPATHPRSSTS